LRGAAIAPCQHRNRAGGAAAGHGEWRAIMGIMSIVWMILVGFIVGALARFVYPGAVPLGFWLTALLGIGGSIVGGLIGGLIWKSSDGKFHPAGVILSILGAMLLLWGYNAFLR
jgi:uncharacterized membrane protein YeaQ/YmgE (transglycosylase-associated protein family)